MPTPDADFAGRFDLAIRNSLVSRVAEAGAQTIRLSLLPQ